MLDIDLDRLEIQFDYSKPDLYDIRRCLNTLYTTRAGTVALDRDFGINYEPVDAIPEVAKSLLTIEIIEKTAKYEPRVEVTEVIYTADPMTGKLCPTIKVKRSEKRWMNEFGVTKFA